MEIITMNEWRVEIIWINYNIVNKFKCKLKEQCRRKKLFLMCAKKRVCRRVYQLFVTEDMESNLLERKSLFEKYKNLYELKWEYNRKKKRKKTPTINCLNFILLF